MHIEIITTPNEALKESGFGSLKACNNVLDAIRLIGHQVRLNVCKTKYDLDEVAKRNPDLAVLAVKYIPVDDADDIWLSDYFARHQINFTGSSREVLRFDSSKVLAKTHLTNKGIKTAEYFLATPGQFESENALPIGFPLFLKPMDAANGNGIDDLSFVSSFSDYERKISSLYDSYKQPVLAEKYLDGREYSVAIINTAFDKLIVSAVEIIPPATSNGLRILGAQAKLDDSEKLVRIEDPDMADRVTAMATDAFHALGVRDFGRIDIKTDKNGECFFMEANLVPGMTQGSSYFPKACDLALDLPYKSVIDLLLASGLARASSTIPPDIYPGSDRESAVIL